MWIIVERFFEKNRKSWEEGKRANNLNCLLEWDNVIGREEFQDGYGHVLRGK